MEQKQSLHKKIHNLLQKNIISINPNPHPEGLFQVTIPIQCNINVGQLCQGVVIDKDDKAHQIHLHIVKLYPSISKYPINVSYRSYHAFIKDYDIKQDFSIFTYIDNHQHFKVGSYVIATVKRIQNRDSQLFYELSIKNNITKANNNIQMLRVKRDDIEIFQRDIQKFKLSKQFPIDFLVQYDQQFENPGLIKKLIHNLNVKEVSSIHEINNLNQVESLGVDIERIRQIQQKQWSQKHFEEGMAILKSAQNIDISIQQFDIALKFDKKNANILVAKGCALANMNKPLQGLKQIKEALKIDPNNKMAQQYYDQMKKIKKDPKNQQGEKNVKKSSLNEYTFIRKK